MQIIPFMFQQYTFLNSFIWSTPPPILINALIGSFTVLYVISQLYLYPDQFGLVVLVSLMFATIICYIRTWVYDL